MNSNNDTDINNTEQKKTTGKIKEKIVNVSGMIGTKYAEVTGNNEIPLELRYAIKKLIFESISEKLHHEMDTETYDQLKITHNKLIIKYEELSKNARELGMKLLADTKQAMADSYNKYVEDSKESMNSVIRVIDVGESSSKIVVPLARHFQNLNISQSSQGGAYISLDKPDPRDSKEILEFGIRIGFHKEYATSDNSSINAERHFVVRHEVDPDFTLKEWPTAGRLCENIADVFIEVERLMNMLIDPAIAYIIAHDECVVPVVDIKH